MIGTFVNEALAMLGEGVAAGDHRAGDHAGRLPGRRAAAGRRAQPRAVPQDPQRGAATAAGRQLRRGTRPRTSWSGWSSSAVPGGCAGAGFFDYDESGKRTGLWPGLAEHFPVAGDPATVDLHELRSGCSSSRRSSRRAASRRACSITTADANIGSIMGIGFPPWTGGVLQYINGYPGGGRRRFVARADEFAASYGERFEPNPLLRKKAENGETF